MLIVHNHILLGWLLSIEKPGEVRHSRGLVPPGPAEGFLPGLPPSPGGPGVLHPGEQVGVTGLCRCPPGKGAGQPGAPGGQVLQAQPGAGGQVLLPPGGAARDGP